MATTDGFAHMDATAQAELVRRKEVTPLELVEAAIARIEKLNPVLNAVITPMYDLARAVAVGSLPDGPFRGVPFLLKDIGAAYAGVPLTAASAFCRDFVPAYDSELVKRHKRAGLIVIGKTNLSEFGIISTTEPRLFGPTHNPWDTGRTTGGSSGGSAAAVAARLVPMAHGTDGGGSIRIPSSACGVFGLKPTRARISQAPDYGDRKSGLVCDHALTISVRDSAALLDATAGPVAGDPYWAAPPSRPFLQEVSNDPGKLCIAFTTKAPIDVPTHPDCVAAVRDVAALCESLGHEVTEATVAGDFESAEQALSVVDAAGVACSIDRMARATGKTPTEDQFEALTWAYYRLGHASSAGDYLLAMYTLQKLAREVAQFFTTYDIWLMPTLTEPPIPLGSFEARPDDPTAGYGRARFFAPMTQVANITGQPAMSVPLYWNAAGLPIGTHFVGRFGDEATLFRLAAQLEVARPWADRCPPVSAC